MVFCSSFKLFSAKPIFYVTTFRNLRSISRRTSEPRLIKNAKIKTETEFSDEFSQIKSYNQFVDKSMKSKNMDELEIEEAFSKDEDFGGPYLKAHELYDYHEKEEKLNKKFIKKKIIQRKYFKLDYETNLLTYAAKEQIRYLNLLNSTSWSPEILAENFPITVCGVKKLLKNNFELRTHEKIEKHDQEVFKRWKALKSGEPTQLISHTTQKLWNERQILNEDYFDGNPLLPQPMKKTNKIVIDRTRETVGEFSSIVQKYVSYKKKMDSNQKVNKEESRVKTIKDAPQTRHKNLEHEEILKEFKRYRIEDEHNMYQNSVSPNRRSKNDNDQDIPFEQFSKNLKESVSFKKSKSGPKYVEWLNSKPTQDDCIEDTPKVKTKFQKITKHKKDIY